MGKWNEETNSGQWSFDGDTRLINLTFNEDTGEETQWRVQGTGSVVLWLGNTEKNKTGAQMKLAMTNTRPQQ